MGDLRAKRDQANDEGHQSVDVVPGFPEVVPKCDSEGKAPARKGKKVIFTGGY